MAETADKMSALVEDWGLTETDTVGLSAILEQTGGNIQ